MFLYWLGFNLGTDDDDYADCVEVDMFVRDDVCLFMLLGINI